MKKNIISLVFLAFVFLQGKAQTITPDLNDHSKWTIVNRKVVNITDGERKGVYIEEKEEDGGMILNNFEFSEGTIEFDIKGRNVLQKSFVGVGFHLQEDKSFDGIYFRPFNFSNPDTVRRGRAVQYVHHPDFPWDKLRKDFPGKYENKVNPVPDPDGWFHAKIVVEGKNIKVFVNDSAKPSLVVEKLSNTRSGKIFLWAGVVSDVSFANLKITPSKMN
jgi:hypothetical protein